MALIASAVDSPRGWSSVWLRQESQRDIRSNTPPLWADRSAGPAGSDSALCVFVSSTMTELRALREMLEHRLEERGLEAQIFETSVGARPGTVETSFSAGWRGAIVRRLRSGIRLSPVANGTVS